MGFNVKSFDVERWMRAVEENDENIFLHLVENGFCKEVLGEEIHRS